MTDDYTALIERLNEHALGLESAAYLLKGAALDDMRRETATVHEAAAALRAQAQTIERLTKERNEARFDEGLTHGMLHDELEVAEARIERLTKERDDLEHEVAHAYWNSCGCLAGGVGHQEGSPECRALGSSTQTVGGNT